MNSLVSGCWLMLAIVAALHYFRAFMNHREFRYGPPTPLGCAFFISLSIIFAAGFLKSIYQI